jgi:DNA-binding IclR family transcriptional regulator
MDGGDLFPNLPKHHRHSGRHLEGLTSTTPPPAANRSAILAFLDRPRTAKAIAEHIGRRVPATIKRLEVLVERGLVATPKQGFYVRTKLGTLKVTASSAEQSAALKALAFLIAERATVDVAAHIGRTRDTTSRLLAEMCRRQLVVRVGWGIWQRADCCKPSAAAEVAVKPTRPQPIRDAILAFLAEPKSAKEIATHIGRPVPVATGHLRAMRERDLVVRVSWGVWVRRDCCDNAPDPATIHRNFPAQEALLKCLDKPRSLDELETVTGSPRTRLHELLVKLVASGAVRQRPGDRYALAAR